MARPIAPAICRPNGPTYVSPGPAQPQAERRPGYAHPQAIPKPCKGGTIESPNGDFAGCGDREARSLVVFEGDTYWGLSYFRKSESATLTHHAGFISSRTTADRIVAACHPAK